MMKSWWCLSVCYLLKVFFLLGQIVVVECQFGHGNNFVIFFMLPRNKKDSLTMGQNLLQALFLTSGRHQTSMSLFIAPGAWRLSRGFTSSKRKGFKKIDREEKDHCIGLTNLLQRICLMLWNMTDLWTNSHMHAANVQCTIVLTTTLFCLKCTNLKSTTIIL